MKRKVILPAIVIVPLAAWLFWPLTSDTWRIETDDKRWEAKQRYLRNGIEPDSSSPNVLLIIVDDLSIADVTLYDEDAPVETPNLNSLAEQGVKFNNAYVTHSICSPSRAAILTGRYPQRFGFEHQMHDRYLKNRMEYFGFKYFVDSDPWVPQWPGSYPDEEAMSKQGLPQSEITLAELMKTVGYATGLIGKWHLGNADFNQPCNMGFDEFYGFNASHSLYAPEGTPGIVDQKIDGDWTDPYIWSGQRNGPHAITRDCNATPDDLYLTFRIANESKAFIDRHREGPFFLVSSFNAPHTPLQAPQEYVDMYNHIDDPVKRVHYAMIKCLDDAIGDLIQHLESSGLVDNTLIFMISDNGGAEYNLTTENGPYRGGKITDFEGGVKVPFVMRYNRRAALNGSTYNYPVSAMDIFSTIVGQTSADLPEYVKYDGVDLLPVVAGNRPAHQYLFWRRGYNASIRDLEWKTTWNTFSGDTMLYDLSADPYERNNLFADRPEVAIQLINQHSKWADDLPGPAWPSVIHFTCVEDDRRYWFDN